MTTNEATANPDKQRTCLDCGHVTFSVTATKHTHGNIAADLDHPVRVELAHPMDSDPFAGLD